METNTKEFTLIFGCDHGGFELKKHLLHYCESKNINVEDLGCYTTDAVDYPVIAQRVAERIINTPGDLGIIICGSGIGVSIAANRYTQIRAALCTTPLHGQLARAHNNANILCLGGRITPPEDAEQILEAFLTTQFEGGRHEQRVNNLTHMPTCE
jgi:ribose 5-phosphate isomerase B